MAEPRPTPLSFRPAARVARDETFDESLFDRVAQRSSTRPAPDLGRDDEDASLEDESEGEEAPATREGLPSSYRMRHDSHYVEQIAARPRPTIPVSVFSELTEHLGAIGACLHLFGDRERPLRERVAIDLVHAEVQRAAWLSQALAVLSADPSVVSNAVDVGPLARRVVRTFAPEHVLARVEFDCDFSAGLPAVRGDEQLLGIALAGMIASVHALVDRVPGSCVRVQAVAFRDEVRVSVGQDLVSLPPASRTRFFDLAWMERPGGVGVGARLAAARRIAELHGGRLQLAATDPGCALALGLPTNR